MNEYELLAEEIRALAKQLKVTEPKATEIMGYCMKLTEKTLTAIEAREFILELVKKKLEDMNNDERLLCIALGVLVRKLPFTASANKVGRNDLCPCESGAKYKNCCLELAKAHDYRRYYEGN
jgi:uncharacterized protein YecA (UPF0149 family)